jgi:hypothetical protein
VSLTAVTYSVNSGSGNGADLYMEISEDNFTWVTIARALTVLVDDSGTDPTGDYFVIVHQQLFAVVPVGQYYRVASFLTPVKQAWTELL